jgi:hypothetical protein
MTTLQLSTEDHSQDEQTSFQPGSLVNLTALQENVWRLVTSVIYGARSCEFWGKRNLNGSWERMSQDSLALNLDDSLGEWLMTWPRWGLVSDGVCMELRMSEQSTGETGSSSLPTPQAFDALTFKKADLSDKTTKNGKRGGRSNLREVEFHKMLPTPRTSQDHKPLRQLCPSEANGTHGITLVGAIGDALDVATGGGGVLNPYFVQKMMGFPNGWV